MIEISTGDFKMVTLIMMWAYASTPVTMIQFTSLRACMTAAAYFDETHGEALAVLRCVDGKTGVVK